MSEQRENVFQMLDDDEGSPEGQEALENVESNSDDVVKDVAFEPQIAETLQETTSDNDAWTDVSTKSRRLAPQFTLSKQDFSSEKTRPAVAPHKEVEPVKKRGAPILFSKFSCSHIFQ